MATAHATMNVQIKRTDDFGFDLEVTTERGKLLHREHIAPGSWAQPVTFLNQEFGQKVRTFRGEYSLRQAAEMVRVSAATLSRIERGQMPDIQTFFQLCQWMALDPSQFVLVESDEE